MFASRPDATLVRDQPAVRRFMPFIAPRRNESLVYFRQEIDVEAALAFVEQRNRSRPAERPITLFHLVLRAIARRLEERPRMNRFTAGGRLWQRNAVWITYSAKKRLDDDSPLITLKRSFPPDESLDEMVDRLQQALGVGRSGRKSSADREMSLLLRLPSPLVRLLLRLVRGFDALGLLPRAFIDSDPLFTSAFVANLGSVGLDAGYHHLWEYGSCPIFCVIGRIRPGADGRRRIVLKWSYDERIEDGLYCARGLEGLRELIEHPEKL